MRAAGGRLLAVYCVKNHSFQETLETLTSLLPKLKFGMEWHVI
jgi:hypothetical protein